MPLIEVNIWKGMDEKKKEILISRLTDTVCEVIGCPKQAVHIILREVPKENWADSGVQHSVKFRNPWGQVLTFDKILDMILNRVQDDKLFNNNHPHPRIKCGAGLILPHRRGGINREKRGQAGLIHDTRYRIYFVRVETEGKTIIEKIIKTRWEV